MAAPALALAGAGLGGILATAALRFGTLAILAPAVLVGLVVLALNSELLLLVLLSGCVLVELEDPLVPSLDRVLYNSVFKGLSLIDFAVLLLIVAALLDAVRHRSRVVGAGPLTLPLVLVAVASISGAVVGHYGGASLREINEPLVRLSHVVLLPFIAVSVARDHPGAWPRFLKLMIGLVALKSALGVWIALSSTQADVDGHAVSFLEPTADWLALLYLFGLLAARLGRVRLPLWSYGVGALALASLVMSYRRSFWLGAVVGLVVVLILGAGPRGRRVVVPVLALLGLLAVLALSTVGSTSTSTNPVLERAASFSPSHLTTNVEDRYRIDERRDVLANLRQHPLTGLGISVPWTAPHPLSTEHPSGRLYTHMIVLWYWMNLGLLGLLAYVSLMVASLLLSWRVWRHHPDPFTRALGLAMLGAIAGLMTAETTGSFTGVDGRFSIVLPIALGFLVHAWRQTSPARGDAPWMSSARGLLLRRPRGQPG